MAPFAAKNIKVWMDEYDISGDLNAVALEYGADMQEDTTFGDDTKSNQAGLKTASMEMEGYWQAGTDKIDPTLFTRLGVSAEIFTFAGETGAEGETGFILRPYVSDYSFFGSIGDMDKFKASAQGGNHRPLVRATIAHNATKVASGNGTAFQIGLVGATQKLYASLHVLALTGTSLTAVIQSDDAVGFPSPTARITFNAAVVKSAQYGVLAGPIATDNFWRVNYTLVGTSVTFVVAIGIQ